MPCILFYGILLPCIPLWRTSREVVRVYAKKARAGEKLGAPRVMLFTSLLRLVSNRISYYRLQIVHPKRLSEAIVHTNG
jgi:hypothetical protein